MAKVIYGVYRRGAERYALDVFKSQTEAIMRSLALNENSEEDKPMYFAGVYPPNECRPPIHMIVGGGEDDE